MTSSRGLALAHLTCPHGLVQDRVPAFPVARARAIIEAELGAPPERLFGAFDQRPLAAASLGQVPACSTWSSRDFFPPCKLSF